MLDEDAISDDVAKIADFLRRLHVDKSDEPMKALAMLATALHVQAVMLLSQLTGGDHELAAQTLLQAHVEAG